MENQHQVCPHTHIIGVSVGRERYKETGRIFEEITVKNSQI